MRDPDPNGPNLQQVLREAMDATRTPSNVTVGTNEVATKAINRSAFIESQIDRIIFETINQAHMEESKELRDIVFDKITDRESARVHIKECGKCTELGNLLIEVAPQIFSID